MRKLLATAVAVAAVSIPLVTASTANASIVSGGYYTTSGACNQAGKNIVSNPNGKFVSWTCVRTTGSAPWHLLLET
ncbi:hypothetical protein [Psychromicrobium lacuslunae]|uniref:Chitin-binding type-3 domain-containing protein n=1 Tax=Psychromicrobium lacuslunae TaxID=1618207 RepID=A0A0D4BXS6_9MICC|nr:hypothetical protein [Psychromicrobium lacuslunae]AJT41118.1 hypothetical protein UM93_05555 [Psychromicrobium lacuslunae]